MGTPRAELDVYPDLHQASGGSPGRALRLLQGIEECQGLARIQELLAGKGWERPEVLVDHLPPRAKESKREHAIRFLELLLDVSLGERSAQVNERFAADQRALHLAGLIRDLRGNQNPELIFEELGQLLRPPRTPS